MIISNLKRSSINCINLKEEDLEKLLLSFSQHYYNIYENTRPYDYYPAINLAYMSILFNVIFSTHHKVNSYNLKKIYRQVKEDSIYIDKKSKERNSQYYAIMTELEFHLLFEQKGVVADIYIMLDTLQPSSRLVEQTLEQIRWFLEVLNKFSKKDIFLDEFVKVVEILEGYEGAK